MKTASVFHVPPRPNLGPEAFEHRAVGAFWGLAGCIITLGSASAIYFLLLRFTKRRRSFESSTEARPPELERSDPDFTSLVRAVRNRLSENFGEGIRAKTTEELTADLAIRESLGQEGTSNLIGFLRATDLMRFGSPGRDDPQRLFNVWSKWAEAFCSGAGARSTTKGK